MYGATICSFPKSSSQPILRCENDLSPTFVQISFVDFDDYFCVKYKQINVSTHDFETSLIHTL